MEGKDSHAQRHQSHHGVLVERVALAEDGQVQEHDGEQLAALGQDERHVVDVLEAGVAERRGETAGQRDERQGTEYARRGEDGRRRSVARFRGQEVYVAGQEGE